jgi:peptide/nickel transport system substrate-binding protein
MNYAIDVQALIDNLFNGQGVRQASPVLTGALGYDPSVLPYDYNPALARQLLADAGYPNGFSATMDFASSDPPAPGLAVIGQLAQVGVQVTPRMLELAQFNAAWRSGQSSDLRIARWGGMQDPAVFLNFTTVCGGFLASPFVCNQDITSLAKAAANTLDQDERARLYGMLSGISRNDPMGIYLSNAVTIYGIGPRVSGWRGTNGRDFLIPTNLTLIS